MLVLTKGGRCFRLFGRSVLQWIHFRQDLSFLGAKADVPVDVPLKPSATNLFLYQLPKDYEEEWVSTPQIGFAGCADSVLFPTLSSLTSFTDLVSVSLRGRSRGRRGGGARSN